MPIKTSWDLTTLFANDNDTGMEKEKELIEHHINQFANKWKNRTDYLENPETLKEALDNYEKLMNRYGTDGKLGYYFWLRSQQDQINSEIKAKNGKAEEFSRKMLDEIRFFENKIAKINSEKSKEILSSSHIKNYHHFLEKTFASGKHLLSDSEERILSMKSKTSHENWVKMISEFLAKEEREVEGENGKEIKNFSEISSLVSDRNKKIRDSAAHALNSILKKHLDVAENELNSVLENKKTNDELRNYTRADSSRHLGDDIEGEIVDSLVEAVSSKFNIAKRFYSLKAKLLKVPHLEYHERNVPYGEITEKYTIERAVQLTNKVFAQLDSVFSEILMNSFEKGLVDVYPAKGKRGGAFCVWWSPAFPVYVELNHTETLRDVLTLAHEFGHAINGTLSNQTQNSLNFNTPTSTSEVASTFMEDFVLEELMKNADDETKLSLRVSKLNEDISTIFRQIACYNFEHEIHKEFRKKGYLNQNEIGKIFQNQMEAYMGPSVKQSEGSENWWVLWSHIRTYFYVYSYASGLLISKALQNKVKENPAFIQEIKKFLSSGCAHSPKDIFLKLGIDITDKNFWVKGISEIEKFLDETEQLALKLGKI